MTYVGFICDMLNDEKAGMPIYISRITEALATAFGLNTKAAAAAVSVAVKRIMDGAIVSDLRCYQKGIYYRTSMTPFGEMGINKEQLIADKYLNPDIGYETGAAFLHGIGLTTQMPRERILATNAAKDGARTDKKLGVVIRPAKVKIDAQNKAYLQTLDALDCMDKMPVDADRPYLLLAQHIRKHGLQYEKLLYYADRCYNRNTVMQLAHTACEE